MKNERIKLIIKNIELLLEQLKLEVTDDPPVNENVIHINELLTKDDYEDPEYYEEPDVTYPNVSVRWRDSDAL